MYLFLFGGLPQPENLTIHLTHNQDKYNNRIVP